MLLSVMMLALFLSLPSLACAGDSYSDELRLLDLELEERVARWQVHVVCLVWIPSGNNQTSRVWILVDRCY